MNQASIFDLNATKNDGSELKLDDLRGKLLLIVNTASNCGFTPQYAGLEALHKKYSDKGLVILGFPCDQFAHQEPGTDSEIAQFCSRNFGVTFQLMAKIDVNGKNTHPVFKFLKAKAPGTLGTRVKWNFTKFLVSIDGTKVQRFSPATEPKDMERSIERLLPA